MNKKLEEFARATLKEGLNKLPETNQLFFKRMYSPENLGKDINLVVDNIPKSKLSHAMIQVQNTLGKLNG